MIIFEWENSIIEIARTWPQQGILFEFFKFWTSPSESFWLLLPFLMILGYKIGYQKLISPAILVAVTVLIGDFFSRRIFKAFIQRPRPNFVGLDCHFSKCWGFVSSHSTNITAAAIVLSLYEKRNTYWTLPVVLFVSFSRVYLIDHFPLDVLGGNLLGIIIGVSVFFWFNKIKKRPKGELTGKYFV